MRKRSLLMLAVAILAGRAISQEIVIEPTNGRSQAANRASRAAVVESVPKSSQAASHERSASKKPTTGVSSKQIAAKTKAAPADSKVAAKSGARSKSEVAKSDTPEATPAPRKVPARPTWAISDTRDARSLQVEIANALARDPKLADSSIQVRVDDGAVTLEGRASGAEERVQAQRLAQSYAWNRKLVDRIEIVRRVSAQK
jgi:osmotically-inducible protein OsmY